MNLSGLHRKFVLNGRDTLDPNAVNGPTQLLSLGYVWESVPGIDTDGVSTANANQGTKTFIYVQNGTVTGFAAGDVVARDLSGDCVAIDGIAGTSRYMILGVVVTPIAAGEYGFVQQTGLMALNTSAVTFTPDFPLACGAHVLTNWIAAADDSVEVIGHCLTSAVAGLVKLDCRG